MQGDGFYTDLEGVRRKFPNSFSYDYQAGVESERERVKAEKESAERTMKRNASWATAAMDVNGQEYRYYVVSLELVDGDYRDVNTTADTWGWFNTLTEAKKEAKKHRYSHIFMVRNEMLL